MPEINNLIEKAYGNINQLSKSNIDEQTKNANSRDHSKIKQWRNSRCRKISWRVDLTHQWIKQAILLYFRIQENKIYGADVTHFYDKIPLKYADAKNLATDGVISSRRHCTRRGFYR